MGGGGEGGGKRARAPPGCHLHLPQGKRRGPADHTDLRDHVGDVAGVGGQQEGVGLFRKLGEGAHVLLCHRERGSGAAVLGKRQTMLSVPPRASSVPLSPARPGW